MDSKLIITALLFLLVFMPLSAMAAIVPLSFTVNVSENVVLDTAGGKPSLPI